MASSFRHPRSGLELEPHFGFASMRAIEVATGQRAGDVIAAAQKPGAQLAALGVIFWSTFARYGEHAPTMADVDEMIDLDQQRALDATGLALAAYAERSRGPGAK